MLKLVIGMTLVGIVGGGAVQGQAHHSPIADKPQPLLLPLSKWAHKATKLPDWHDYTWLSDDSLLTFDPVEGMTLVTNANRVDVESGQWTPLDAYNRKLKGVTDGTSRVPTLSPDHQWVFWFWGRLIGPAVKWYALRLDGTEFRTGRITDLYIGNGVWSNHSDEWITLDRGAGSQIPVLHYPLAPPNKVIRSQIEVPNLPDVNWFPLVGLTPGGLGLATDAYGKKPTGSLDLYLVDVQTGKTPSQKWTIRFPEGAQCCEFKLSPQEDRWAWLFFIKHPAHERKVTHSRSATYELWISDLKGENMHCVGYENVRSNTDVYRSVDMPALLRWSPNGKRISIDYDQTVYVLPAE